ncbi:hypothetical protein [Streptomyces sp. RerS4]|uniref:hypothetical protein n=1 Tax=Streptomyces sp. RerS4 TaxID=2942449 RepID=UPI00201BDBCC|nr:hypothetical protein [Streptomyces sp. RerS4]UQX02627.1 hypothetical protein M4D82_20605 [Streptomyces sp. RerS4]
MLVGVVAAVVAGGAVAAWMLLGDRDGRDGDARPPASPSAGPVSPPGPDASPDVSESPTPTPSPTASASASGTGTPGYTVVRDAYGFSVAVPAGWRSSDDETGNGAFYRPPGDRRALLQIFRVTESSATGSCELLRLSSERLRDGTPQYREVSVDPVAGSACELVYEYDSAESQGRRRGIERIITLPDGKRWALLAAGPVGDSATTRAHLTAALDSFHPE